jgi:tetratricopeptide (TPR) repeat protein
MRARSIAFGIGVAVLLVAGGAGALLYGGRKDVTTSSREAARFYREAMQNERSYYFKEARVGYAEALRLDPEFAEAMLGLARISGDLDQSADYVKRAARLTDRLTERERLHVAMQLALIERRREDAVKIANDIHAKHPDDVRAAMLLANEAMLKGNSDGAIRIFEDVIATDPNNADAYNQIGYLYGYRGDTDRAVASFKKYQFMLPGSANPYDSLGEVQANAGRYEEAIANLNAALKIKPDFFESIGHLGIAYEGMGDYARAMASYEKAAELADSDGKRGDCLSQAARVAFCMKDRVELEKIAAKVSALPKTPYTELNKDMLAAAVALLAGRPNEAQRLLGDVRPKWEALVAKEKPPAGYTPDLPAWNLLSALAFLAQHQDAEALPLLERVANPPNPPRDFSGLRYCYRGRAQLAALLARRGELDKAEKLLEENHKWNPSWAPTKDLELSVAQARREKVLAATK